MNTTFLTGRRAHLRRNAQPIARQQHAFDGLAVAQPHQQALAAVSRGVGGVQAGKGAQVMLDGRQCGPQRRGQEVLDPPFARILRTSLRPMAQHAVGMRRKRAGGLQAQAPGANLAGE
jgi:hypothetical protein